MDYEDSDVTSAGNTTHINECSICHTELEKTDSPILSLPSDFCQKCSKKLKDLNTLCSTKISKIHKENTNLIQADFRNSKHLQESKSKALSRIKEFKSIESINSKIRSLKRDLNDSIFVIKANLQQKQQLCDELNKKQCELSEKNNKVQELKIQPSRGTINIMDSLVSENHDLLEKIRDFEIDSFLFNKELLEALKQVKLQSSKEKSLKQCYNFHNLTDLQNLQEIQKSLREEISITKQRISGLSGLLSG